MDLVLEGLGPLCRLLAADTLAVIAATALVAWCLRGSGRVFAWLSFASLTWCLYVLGGLVPAGIEAPSFHGILTVLIYPLLFATIGLAAAFLEVALPRSVILGAGCATMLLAATAMLAPFSGLHRLLSLAGVGLTLVMLGILVVRSPRRSGLSERTCFAFLSVLALISAALDILAAMYRPDAVLLFSPYAGVTLMGYTGLAVLRGGLAKANASEKLNAALGERIETTKANLLVSESARHSLEVAHAVKLERERLMREIHDGIGSSLVAALSSAERQGKESTTAVVALKGALTDLRVAIDSLEPVEGNVATLLASLRYRYEPELQKSGVGIKWMVEDVPELEWLDAPSALHVLRILQEAISNTLGHGKATQLGFKCKMALMSGRPGLRVEVADNGIGFETQARTRGRGLRNMVQRAEALGGKLEVVSRINQGTTTILWLPLIRRHGLTAQAAAEVPP